MGLLEGNRIDLVRYRMEKAWEALEQVRAIGRLGYWTLAANRMYYSAYYASVALLLSDGIGTLTHKGVRTMMGLHYFKSEKLPSEYGVLIGRLYTMRQAGDYEDWTEWDESQVTPMIPEVERFLNDVETLLSQNGGRVP